jgi:uncharacterized protein involved in response to NO
VTVITPKVTDVVAQPASRGGLAWLDSPYRLLIRISLSLGVGAGFSLGLYLLLGFALGLPLSAGTPALMQVHGHVQVFGFLAMFIMAVGVQLFPRFHATRLDRPAQVSAGGMLLGTGVALRAIAQPLAVDAPFRPGALLLSAMLALVGVVLVIHAFARVIRGGVGPSPSGWRALLPATMGASLVLTLVLNIAACVALAQGASVVPFAQDETLIHFELWGFASTMVLAVSGRVFPKFLLLQPSHDRLFRPALALWALGSIGTPVVWVLLGGAPAARSGTALAQLVAAVLFVAALRLYELPTRESGTPSVTNLTRRWARLAFAALLTAAAANLGIATAEALGLTVTSTQISAARHLLAQGFLLPLMVLMAARILPAYSGYMLYRPRLLSALVWALLVGAILRGGAELIGGYGSGWSSVVGLGGLLAVIAVVIFALGLWRATGRDPVAGPPSSAAAVERTEHAREEVQHVAPGERVKVPPAE